MTKKKIKCAIYTRKSTEEGLDKEFNSLEAQREACEAYIKSQMHEGWELIPAAYDDGGFTGGNMDRPALKALMAEIKAGNVDVIVVYKVDRLSRSLNDFAQMVNVFDAHDVSFVSITQQFNTTSSMGRLTLNILLSFAQFEREVIGERVRDKVAASKKKGMWMGGHPPLGYDIKDRKLEINQPEANLVKVIFERYLQMRSGEKLADALNAEGYRNKSRVTRKGRLTGGQEFLPQAVYKVLSNPIYIGKVRHKDQVYDGQHPAIISNEIWHAAQELLASGNAVRGVKQRKHRTMFEGKCFSPSGEVYSPTYTVKNKTTHYRYYYLKSQKRRIKGPDIEELVFDTIYSLARKKEYWVACWQACGSEIISEEAQHRWKSLWASWTDMTSEEKYNVAQQIVERIVITDDQVTIRLSYQGIKEIITGFEGSGAGQNSREAQRSLLKPTIEIGESYIEIKITAKFQTYGRTQIAVDASGKPIHVFEKTKYNPVLVNALVRSFKWNRALEAGKSITEIAAEFKLSRSYVSSVINLMFLAPDIIEMIMNGKQSSRLMLKDLLKGFPKEWDKQRELFDLRHNLS